MGGKFSSWLKLQLDRDPQVFVLPVGIHMKRNEELSMHEVLSEPNMKVDIWHVWVGACFCFMNTFGTYIIL